MELDDLELLALEGNVELQYQLGMLFKRGDEIKPDYVKAVKYLKMAADNGDDAAQCELGRIYCTGEGVSLDYKEGFKWFKLASDQNNEIAQGNIGFMYENGYGVIQDYTEAFKYYLMAAKNGDTVAKNTVANMYEKGIGVEQNINEANKWLKDAKEDEKLSDNKEKINIELSNELHEKISANCKVGDELAEDGKYAEAIQYYMKALELVPNPKRNWQASTWIYTALGDAYFLIGKYEEAKNHLFDALNCPDGIANPFILLRLGESFYEIGDTSKSKEYLIQAYMLEGANIFEDEDEKYYKIIEDII